MAGCCHAALSVVVLLLTANIASAWEFHESSSYQRGRVGLIEQNAYYTGGEKPGHEEYAAMARWLVAESTWGVLSTVSKRLKGSPFGNVVSFSDGPAIRASGQPYFYLTALDPTASDVVDDARCSLTVAEMALGTCGKNDPESPACAKLTLSGQLKRVEDEREEEFARDALFSKHDEMKHWPASHGFHFYKLQIEDIFLVDWFGGAKLLTVENYFRTPSPNNPRDRELDESVASMLMLKVG